MKVCGALRPACPVTVKEKGEEGREEKSLMCVRRVDTLWSSPDNKTYSNSGGVCLISQAFFFKYISHRRNVNYSYSYNCHLVATRNTESQLTYRLNTQ